MFVHNILTKKYSFKGNIKEKKLMLLENSLPPPPPPIIFLMVRPLNARKQKIFGATFCRLTSDLKTCHTILSQNLEGAF